MVTINRESRHPDYSSHHRGKQGVQLSFKTLVVAVAFILWLQFSLFYYHDQIKTLYDHSGKLSAVGAVNVSAVVDDKAEDHNKNANNDSSNNKIDNVQKTNNNADNNSNNNVDNHNNAKNNNKNNDANNIIINNNNGAQQGAQLHVQFEPNKAVPGAKASENKQLRKLAVAKLKPNHFFPMVPPLPPHAPIPDAAKLMKETYDGTNPTIAGVQAILTRFLNELHAMYKRLAETGTNRDEVVMAYMKLANQHLVPLDKINYNRVKDMIEKPLFPIRKDYTIYMAIPSYRDIMLGNTLKDAFSKAKFPERLYVGVVVQNCWGVDYTCRTGIRPTGHGDPQTGQMKLKVTDAPPDVNGVEEFCNDDRFSAFCQSGQLRVLYVNETESLGAPVAQYLVSKLWGGETYYMQVDSHTTFAPDFDFKLYMEYKHAHGYPSAILSSHPIKFDEFRNETTDARFWERPGTRLCLCGFEPALNNILRVGNGMPYSAEDHDKRPSQVAFMSHSFFFTTSQFIVDVPYDPMLPFIIMGDEALHTLRAYSHGYKIYGPRINVVATQNRPGKLGFPKFWETVFRVFHKPNFNSRCQLKVQQRVKYILGYTDATDEKIEIEGEDLVLTEVDFYGVGNSQVHTREAFYKEHNIDVKKQQCHAIRWCQYGEQQ